MTTMPNMKLPDILSQLRKKNPAAGQGDGKSYQPIQPGRGNKSHEPVRPRGGGSRAWPLAAAVFIIAIIFAVGEFIKSSEPFQIASSFVKENRLIREDLGEITEITPWFPSSLKAAGEAVRVRLTLRIAGRNGTGKVFCTLAYLKNSWQLTAAAYEDRRGRLTTLTMGAVREAPLPAPGDSGKLSTGHRFFRQNDFQQAVTAYSQSIAADPNNSSAYYWRGRSYYKLNLPDKASADFSKTVALNPNHAEAFNWLGWLAEKGNRYDACIAYLTKSIALKTDNAWGYYHRGRCNYQRGKRNEAWQDADQACRLGYEQACKVAKQLQDGK